MLGIGGSGMLPLARFANSRKIRVAGSDPQLDAETIAALVLEGIEVYQEVDPLRLEDWPLVVFSSAIPQEHPEMLAALQRQAEGRAVVLHRMDFLNLCFEDCPTLFAVAGTHGKTTTTSMLAWLLCRLGLDPDVIVGGRPHDMPRGFRVGNGRVGIYETDESDGSFLRSEAALRILLNIDRDHLDHYGDLGTLADAFGQFLRAGRQVTINLNDPALVRIAEAAADQEDGSPRIVGYSTRVEGGAAAYSVAYSGRFLNGEGDRENCNSGLSQSGEGWSEHGQYQDDRLEIYYEGRRAGLLELKTAGRAIAENALAVLATVAEAHRQGYINIPDFCLGKLIEILNQFPGVERRLERIGTIGGAALYDDYGHHPTAMRAALLALRKRSRKGALLTVIFQPHRYSRTQTLYRQLAQALLVADRIFLLPLYSAGERAVAGVDSALIFNALMELDSSKAIELIEEGEIMLPFRGLSSGDTVIGLGAGNISQLLRQLVAKLPQ